MFILMFMNLEHSFRLNRPLNGNGKIKTYYTYHLHKPYISVVRFLG